MASEQAVHGHRISTGLFPRLLGVVYLIAFLSFGSQARGLVGPDGILPLAPYLRAVASQVPHPYWNLPTLSWLNPEHPPLVSLAAAGAAVSVLLIVGLAPLPCLALLWILYLSLVSDGQLFMGFQWDNLLLEAGLAALLLAPPRLRAGLLEDPEAPPAARWLLYWLLFRLVFGSGLVKLSSGDPHWRDLSALTYHYWTQPLPLWTSWYAARLPLWFQRASALCVLTVELGAPFLIILPATRKAAFFAIAGLMVLIACTGNYCFFNLLTLSLCLLLLRDRDWPKWLHDRLAATSRSGSREASGFLPTCAAGFLALLSAAPFSAQCGLQAAWPAWLRTLEETAEPLRSVNNYGLFAEMTTVRHEIVLEGSDDGSHWKEYGFKWKPGALDRRPGLVAPFQPRLDWQLWFAALGSSEENPWFEGFCARILQGSPDVLNLLAFNPFPKHPPRYLRALLYDYRFTDAATRQATGAWWRRTLIQDYLPPVSLAGALKPR